MIEHSITTAQVHSRGVPANQRDINSPGSIIEHLSTSMRVISLRCSLIAPTGGCDSKLFEVDEHIVHKTRERFYRKATKEFDNKVFIRTPDKIKLLVPKSSTETYDNSWNLLLSIWPEIFICNQCGLIFSPSIDDKRNIQTSASFKECDTLNCVGELRQTPHILQCKICGSIRHIPSTCKNCNGRLYLRKGTETDLETWRLECEKGDVFDFKDYPEYYCSGEDLIIPQEKHIEIAEGGKAARSLMTTVGRGIFSPLVLRFPVGESQLNIANDELHLIAFNGHVLNLGRHNKIRNAMASYREGKPLWNKVRDELESNGEPSTDEDVSIAIKGRPADGIRSPPTVGEWESMTHLLNYEVKGHTFICDTEELKHRCEDWVTLISGGQNNSHSPTDLDQLSNKRPELANKINHMRARLHIKQAHYIERLAIVTGTYGAIRGSVHPIYRRKPHDAVKVPLERVAYDYVDHKFSVVENDTRGFPVIVTKRETEGIAFTLDAKRIMSIIAKNWPELWNELATEGSREPSSFTEEEASAWLAYASHENRFGKDVLSISKRIVHTFSHAVIHRFSIASGLRAEDIGEILFPEFASFVIYNGLEIPLGMLSRVFEDKLLTLLDDEIIEEMKDCDMDPTCGQQEEGAACHACLHVPEHVCEDFNAELDRHALVGRGAEGYWS